MGHELDVLHCHSGVEPRQRNDGEEERRETEADDQKNGYTCGTSLDQILDDL